MVAWRINAIRETRARWPVGLDSRVLNAWLVGLALVVAAQRYLSLGPRSALWPTAPTHESGWWTWWDQGKYLDAARAWAAGNLDPSQHWYLPGYPLLAAPFTSLMPAQPFAIPDLVCLLASLWLFTRLAARLAPRMAWAPPVAALVFLETSVFWTRAFDAWITPWTTTPTTPLTFACLLCVLRFMERPAPASAFWVTMAGAAIGLFRPIDVVLLMLAVTPFLGWALLRLEAEWRCKLRIILFAIAGPLLPVALLLAAHAAVYGDTLGPYLAGSASMGFEWRLIPIRWVTLFVGPRPLFAEGYGFARMFPWVAPGIAGMAVILAIARRADLARHGLIVAAAATHCAFYLAYRDLNPAALWRFNGYHYFKWIIPVFGLYAVFLVAGLIASRQRFQMLAIGIAVFLSLFFWRAEWRPDPRAAFGEAEIRGPHALLLHGGFRSVDSGVQFKAAASFDAAYFGQHEMRIGGQIFHVYVDFRLLPEGDRLLLVPLRPLPAGDIDIQLDSGVTIDPSTAPVVGYQGAVPGLPCWFRSICPYF